MGGENLTSTLNEDRRSPDMNWGLKRLGIGRLSSDVDGVAVTPPIILGDYEYEAATEALVETFTTPPTKRRKDTIDRAIKALDQDYSGQGTIWNAFRQFWWINEDEQSSLRDWKNPSTPLVKVGSPVFTTNQRWQSAASAYLRSGVYLDELTPNNCGIFIFTRTTGAGTTMGATDVSANGLTMGVKPTTGAQTMTARCGGQAITTLATAADWDGLYFHMVCRSPSDASTFRAFRGPVKKASPTSTAAASMGHIEIMYLGNNANGTIGSGVAVAHQAGGGILNRGLTDVEANVLANVCKQLQIEIEFGAFDEYPAGVAPQEVVAADVIVFGENAQGLCAAYEEKRRGRDVIVVSGWRPQPGMSRSGLGFTDFETKTQLGGLPRWLLTQMQTIQGTASDNFVFVPKNFERVIRPLFDPSKTNGVDVPIHYTSGIASVAKTGARITSFTTVDGKTFTAPYFIDATYEGDLMYMADISVRYGRESSAEFSEDLNGFRGNTEDDGGGNHQFKDHAGNLINIDPYIEEGNAASGLLPSLSRTLGVDTPSVGAADTQSQAFNFRMTTTTNLAYHVPFAQTPSEDFDILDFEPLLRLFDADPTIVLADIIKADSIATGVFDINAKGGFSTDLWGASNGYLNATYEEREQIRQRIANFHNDFWHLLKYYDEPRVLAAVRTSALNHGLSSEHYCRPAKDGDRYNFPPQLYIREGFRLDNDFMMRQGDFYLADGSAPRSDKTVAMASYTLDSHGTEAVADPNGGTPRIWVTGGFESVLSGNEYVPIPYEVICPRKSECENLLVVFAGALTHAAFGSWRMEFTTMQAAQSASVAIDVAIDAGNIAVQDVDYATLRTAILASATLSGETAPVLTQTN